MDALHAWTRTRGNWDSLNALERAGYINAFFAGWAARKRAAYGLPNKSVDIAPAAVATMFPTDAELE